MKKLLPLLFFGFLSIIIGASILSKENKETSPNRDISQMLTGPAGEYKIDSSMVGEKIKFSYFHSTPTDKPTLEIYLIDKLEK